MNDKNDLPEKVELTAESEIPRSTILAKWLAIIGALFLIFPPIGFISTVIAMIDSFEELKLSGVGDPKLIAGVISTALVTSVLTLIAGTPGALLLFISIVFFKYRKPWVYRALLVTSFLTIILFPIGTVIAVVMLIILFKNRQKFFEL